MVLEQSRDDLILLLHQLRREIGSAVSAADGPETAELVGRYLSETGAGVSLGDIVDAKLKNFVRVVWSHTWASDCFDSLKYTKGNATIRTYQVLSQYKHLVNSVEKAISFIPELRKFGISYHSGYCRNALVKAGLYAGAGCQMCAPFRVHEQVCSDYCMNVAKGCLRPLLCYQSQWTAWLTHQRNLVRELIFVSRERKAFINEQISSFDEDMMMKAARGEFRGYGPCTPPVSLNTDRDMLSAYKSALLVPHVLHRTPDIFQSHFQDLITG